MARRMLAGSLIMFGMIVLQIGAFVWWVDREVADPERLADIATTVVRDETFQAAVAPEIADQLLADVPVDATGATADEELATRESVIVAVHEAMDDPAVVDAIGMAISSFAATVIGDGNTGDGEEASDQITLDLSAVKVSAVEILGDIDPDLAEQVAAVPVPSALSLDTSRFPDLSTPASALTLGWMAALVIGGAIAAFGMLVHPRPAKGLRRIGALLAIGAGIQLGLAWVTTEVIATNIPGDGLAEAGGVGLRVVLESFRIQAFTQLAIGGLTFAAGHVLLWLPRLIGLHRPAAA